MATYQPTAEHVAFMTDLKAVIGQHTHLSGEEILALVSQLVGNLIAAQDQTKHTVETVLKMVWANVQIGNDAAKAALEDTQGQA